MKLPLPQSRAATPGVLMFIGGLGLVYWALSGWGLFGLGGGYTKGVVFGGFRSGGTPVEGAHDHDDVDAPAPTGGGMFRIR